jgi:hypothetical protein
LNYATWKLNFSNSNYGTGPEERIAAQGFYAEAGWVDGQVENGGIVLGYVFGEPVITTLTNWEYTPVTQEEALSFAQSINAEAYLVEDGRIAAPVNETLLLLNTP